MPDELPKEVPIPEVSAPSEDLSEVNKTLMHQLDGMIPGQDKEGSGRFIYMDQSEKTPLFEFSLLRGYRNGVHSVEILPHSESSSNNLQRRFVTSKGVFPESFIDKNGKSRRLYIKYQLDDTGKGQKIVKIYETMATKLGEGQELPTSDADLVEGEDLYFLDSLGDRDYQQIRSYITLFNTGQLKVS